MSWLSYYLLLFGLFVLQSAWKGAAWLQSAPDLLLCLAVAFALFGKGKNILFLVLPAAVLRAGFSADPVFFVLAFFTLAVFLLQEGRNFLFPERPEVQFALAFLAAFVFFTWNDLNAGGARVFWREAAWNGLWTGLFAPVLCFLLRKLPVFRPLLWQR